MTKVALITDIHFGAKKGSEVFLNSQIKFFKEQFIPHLKEAGIKTIFILGDFFDNRIYIDNRIMSNVLDIFNQELKHFDVHFIVGNHDSYHESTIEINSVKIFDLFENAKIYQENTSIEFEGKSIYMSPWITNNNKFLEELKDLPFHDYCFGHFNFVNFKMFANRENDHGLDPTLFFDKFKLTISGHYHTRSSKKVNGNEILYMGNPFHMNRNDIGDDRGYIFLDINTFEYEFFNNTKSIRYINVNYPDKVTEQDVCYNHVDLYVNYTEDYDEMAVQKYLEKLESYNPAYPINLKVVNKIDTGKIEDITENINDVEELIKQSFKHIEIENSEEVLGCILELYSECNN